MTLVRTIVGLVVLLVPTLGLAQGGDGTLTELVRRCAPSVHPETMAAVISAESGGHQFALADAGPVHLPWAQRKGMVKSYFFATRDEAVAKARTLIRAGHTVSLGPSQLNDRQLPRLGLSIEEAFEPCRNLAGGARILTECYAAAERKFGRTPRALAAALSCYNSGDFDRGARDGYVTRVARQAGKAVTLRTGGASSSRQSSSRIAAVPERRQFLWKGPRIMTAQDAKSAPMDVAGWSK